MTRGKGDAQVADTRFLWKRGSSKDVSGVPINNALPKLHVDGGVDRERSHGAIGVLLLSPRDEIIDALNRRLGWVQDHHVAEYQALIDGMRLALGRRIKSLVAHTDSRLLVQQLGDVAKTKKGHLKPLREQAIDLLQHFNYLDLSHVPRGANRGAHALADRALGR